MNTTAMPVPAQAPQPAAPADANALRLYHGMLFLGAASVPALRQEVVAAIEQVRQGKLPASTCPTPGQVRQAERLVIDYENGAELLKRLEGALGALDGGSAAAWQALGVKGVYRGRGTPGRLAFLFPGQGSQYINMLRDLLEVEPIVAETFREADAVMTPILGRPLTSYIFVEGDAASIEKAEDALRDTTITQPAILAVNTALLRMMAKYGFKPEMVIGHSLGEYAALVAAGVLTLPEALRVVSARGQEMAKVAADDNGCMAAVSAPLAEIERIIKSIDGYVVIANINSPLQSVIGGVTASVEAAIAAFQAAGYQATKIPVSHAFHTRIVAPASQPLRGVIAGMNLQTPKIKIVANVTGRDYPTEREAILDILAAQVASPVQFVQGITTLYEEGARIFVEIGPKRVLSSLASDILKDRTDVTILSTNHPRKGGLLSFHEALCRLYAAGVTAPAAASAPAAVVTPQPVAAAPATAPAASLPPQAAPAAAPGSDGRLPVPGTLPRTGSVVISGAGLGLPGRGKHVFDDNNILALLNGDMRIDPLPLETRQAMLNTSPIRLVKSEAGAEMQTIEDIDQTIKLGGQRGAFDPAGEFGMPQERLEAIDISTQLAIAAGIEALRDAGIPLVMAYKQTSTGSFLPDRWKLPAALADETGVIFASAFPGLERMADEASRFYESQALVRQLEELRRMLPLIPAAQTDLRIAFTNRIVALETELNKLDYHFDRRFIFRILAMGHSQFAEYIGARGPNTHVNAACATTTHAVAIAEDWIRAGRARRVVIVAGDDVISGKLSQWVGTSLMASGAATTEGDLRMAALPFDRRRNGMIIGMGAAALVVESEDAVRERGVRAIAEVIATHIANSAYHGTRLSSAHVSQIMQTLLSTAEGRLGLSRRQIAAETVFVSHETYTPARGGSASAEIRALRDAFGEQAGRVVIANTKGFTGHTMGVGIEDVVAVKSLQYGLVPPIANIGEGFEPDPELGDLNLSHGGKYPVQYALRLGAGFGSQIAMTLLRKIPGAEERIDRPVYQRWLADVAGYAQAETEVVQRTLRILDQGAPARTPARSTWQYGQGPTLWAPAPAEAAAVPVPAAQQVVAPAPMPVTPPPGVETPQPVVAAAPSSIAEPAPTPAAPAAVVQAGYEQIKTYLLAAVSQKTGYPVEVLDLNLDLEADLGIDTVKQAELFLAIRTQYNIPRRDDLRLSDYNTLAKVIGFVEDAMKAPAPAAVAPAVSAPAEPVAAPAAPAPIVEPAPAASAPAAVVQAGHEEIKTYLLSAVSEKTGYPIEVLDLDLDLEADLGIDTVKQAELFLAIRTQYNIPRRDDLRLSDYNTLAKVIGFVEDAMKSPAATPAPAAVSAAQPAAVPAPVAAPAPMPAEAPAVLPTPEDVKSYLLAAVSEKTGYPIEVLDLDLDLEADLGIDTVKQAELFASLRAQYNIPRRDDLRLSDYNTLAKVIAFVPAALTAVNQPAAAPVAAQAAAPVPMAATAAPDVEAPQPAASAPAAVIQASHEEIKTYLLSAVSEKTGYPIEVLDLDLDLEADLGIDTVKQAELFAALRAQYNIPRRDDLRLSDYNTLAKVIGFVEDAMQAPVVLPAPMPATAPAVATPQPADDTPLERVVVRRVPVPALRPRLDLCTPTSVSLGEGSRVIVADGNGKSGETLERKLAARKVTPLHLDASLPAEQILSQLSAWQAGGPIAGVYFLPALEIEPKLDDVDLQTWQAGLDERLNSLFTIIKALPEETFLVSATRMGGLHGYSAAGALAPMGGAVSGFTKSVARERPQAFVKVVDFERDATPATIANHLIEETLHDRGALEIGWEKGLRYGIALVERERPSEPNFDLGAGSVFLISGGASAIIRPIVADLVSATRGSFFLIDRAPAPDTNDPDIARLESDRDGLKADLFKRALAKGEKVTPMQVEQAILNLERSATTLRTLQIIQQAGGKAAYLSCDVTDPAAVGATLRKVFDEAGHVDVFLHAAGLERSRKLSSKPFEEFHQVVSVKVDGFFNLYKAMQAAGKLPRAMLFFCSIAGRFGNSGQTDYASANDLLCKVASAMRSQHPEIKTQTIDWSAWSGIGMASRGNIPELMKMAGIDMVDAREAAPLVRAELTSGSGEAVLAGSLGILLEPLSPHGGADLARADEALRLGTPIHSMLSHIAEYDMNRGLVLEAELDPQVQPFLRDHALNGTPVLPGVMGIEGFTVAARHIGSVLASEKGGLEVARLEDIQFLTPFKFYRNRPRRISWRAQALREADGLVVYVSLESDRALATQAVEHQRHFAGKVYLQPQSAARAEAVAAAPSWNGAYTVKSADIYRLYFHGPAFQVRQAQQGPAGLHRRGARPALHPDPRRAVFPDGGHLGDRQDRHAGPAALDPHADLLPAPRQRRGGLRRGDAHAPCQRGALLRCPRGGCRRAPVPGAEGLPHHPAAVCGGEGFARPAPGAGGIGNRWSSIETNEPENEPRLLV